MPTHAGLTRAQGDPGFFGSLAGIARTVGGLIPGPIGTIARLIPGGGQAAPVAPRPILFTPSGILPGGTPGGLMLGPAPGPAAAAANGSCPTCPQGMRLNRSSYTLKNGQFVPKGTRCVSNRRRNVLNQKALRKANSRQRGFLRAVDSTLKTMPTKAGVSKRRRQIAGATSHK